MRCFCFTQSVIGVWNALPGRMVEAEMIEDIEEAFGLVRCRQMG